nr:leptin [Dromaius novaehollandiae]
MRWPGVSLCGLLWMWLPLSCGRPVKIDKVKADTKNLARTLIARIQELQSPYTATGLALVRLRACLDGIARHLDGLQGC